MPLDTAIAQFRQQLDALPQCVILAAPKMPPEDDLKAAVRDILEGGDDPVYSDGIESIDRAEIIDGAIEGEFSDRIGVRSIKRVGFRITPKSIQTWLLNPDEVAKFSLYQADVLALFAPIGSAQGKPMFGKGSRSKNPKKCIKGLICGYSCINRAKKCKKVPSPELAAKIEEAIKSKSKLKSIGFIDPIENDFDEPTASKELFKDSQGETFEFHTPASANSYDTQNTMWPIAIRNGDDFAYYGLTTAGRAASLDQNQIMSLPQSAKKKLSSEDLKKETQFRQDLIAATTPDGGTVVMYARGKSDRDIAQSLGLNPATHFDFSDDFGQNLKTSAEANKRFQLINSKNVFIGRYENGKIRAITEQEIADIDTIKTLRQQQIIKGTETQSIAYTRSIFEKNKISPDAVGDPSEIAQGFADEDALAQKLKATEDRYLGRKPSKIGDYKSYETKADAWAKETFGNFGDGANGFTLAQTKAHDVAHPITHEILNSNSKGISKQLGNLKQADGKPSLLGEEAIVNVVEHLSRGDSIEASILNGLRLARVLSRSPSEGDAAKKYVRSREFKNTLAKMAHDLYRHNNFSLYMDHVRVSNRISGTVRNAGDDFTNSASGG